MAILDNPTKDQRDTIRAARVAFKTARSSLAGFRLRGKAKRKMTAPIGLTADGVIDVK